MFLVERRGSDILLIVRFDCNGRKPTSQTPTISEVIFIFQITLATKSLSLVTHKTTLTELSNKCPIKLLEILLYLLMINDYRIL